ncbi:MAG: caspase family protein [Crocinitomicaceae bacterium]
MKHLYILFAFFLSFQSYSQEIEVITQEKTEGIITLLSYSPDGSLLASGSAKENSVKIWDIASGKIIGKLEGHVDATSSLMFNHDGTQLISSAKDEYLIVWDIVNWQMIDSVKIESPVTWMVRDVNDPDIFYTASESGKVFKRKYSNFQTEEELFSENSPIKKLDASKNHLVSGTSNGKISLYDLTKKEVTNSKKVHFSEIVGLKFFDDGKRLITTGGGGVVHLWNINNLNDSKHIKASSTLITAFDANVEQNRFVTASSNRKIRVWNFEGEEIYEFKDHLEDESNSGTIRALQISPDGSTVASSGFAKNKNFRLKENDNVIRIWDVKRGTLYKILEGHVNPIYTFDFHPVKKELVTLGKDRTVTFWNFNLAEKYGSFQLVEEKREIPPKMKFWSKDNVKKNSNRFFDKITSGDFSGLGQNTVNDKIERGKDVSTGIVKRTFSEREIVKYSSNGKYLITKLPKDEIRYYDLSETIPEYIGPLWSYQTNINQLLCSPDEKYLAVLGSGDSAVSIIDLEKGEFMRKLITPAPEGRLKYIYEANSLAFSPDGKLLAICFNTSKTFVFDTRTWSLVFENILPGNLGYAKGAFVNFSEDGEYMAVSSSFGVKKYDTKNFNVFASEKLKIQGHSAPLDKPSNYAITQQDHHYYIENIFSGEYNKVLRAEPKDITHISVSPYGKFGITTKSGQFLLIEPETGEQEILMVADGDNYIFKTSENYYKVSKEGFDLVTFRIGNRAYPFEQFDAVFNRPDLVLKKLGCDDQELMDLYKLAYEKRIKKLGLKPTVSVTLDDIPHLSVSNTVDIPAITEEQDIQLQLKMTDKNGLSSYNVYINNVPVYGKNGKSIGDKKTAAFKETVSLVHGINKVQVSCRNKNGYESLMQTFFVEKMGEAPERNLYLVTIGTSNYKDERYNLNYAVKDAKDLVTLLSNNTKELYKEVKAKTLYNEEVTAENIKAMGEFLKQSKPDDIVLVFVAGHGVLDKNFDYFFGTYDMDFSNPSGKGLAYAQLEGILDGIKANKKILIMDTCHSGEVDKDDVYFSVAEDKEPENEEDIAFRNVGPAVEENSNATPSRLAGILFNDLRRGTGSTVISSAGGAEFAMESDEWKNGLFTYCLLNGLKNGTADLDEDGKIMLLELQQYVVEKVTLLSHGKQIPNTRIKNLELDFQLW